MGFLTLASAGAGFVLIGIWEALCSSQNPIRSTSPAAKIRTHLLSLIAVSSFSFLVIMSCLVSVADASSSRDKVGSTLQLQTLPVALLFFLYSLLGLSVHCTNGISLPPSVLNLVLLFGFVEEFLLFYLQRKDKSGIENRYFDLLLVPIVVCILSTGLELKSPNSNYPRLARGIGLILEGTWFLQMALSFYTNLIAHGCALHEKSAGNYTIRCKGHPEYHRGRAIVTLQFNCHLALLVLLVVGAFSVLGRFNAPPGDSTRYRPIGAEMQQFVNPIQFTLDSDEKGDGIREVGIAVKEKIEVPSMEANGGGSHQRDQYI